MADPLHTSSISPLLKAQESQKRSWVLKKQGPPNDKFYSWVFETFIGSGWLQHERACSPETSGSKRGLPQGPCTHKKATPPTRLWHFLPEHLEVCAWEEGGSEYDSRAEVLASLLGRWQTWSLARLYPCRSACSRRDSLKTSLHPISGSLATSSMPLGVESMASQIFSHRVMCVPAFFFTGPYHHDARNSVWGLPG